ncbi:MAG: RNA polymerase sigma factor [Anaerovoracaceae bacterium]|jgi:RNA polymerase sigma-70 factor (ECF subfamily)
MKLDNDNKFFEEKIISLYNYLFCCMTTITNDRLLSADIVQETMETAWVKLEQIKKYNNLKTSLLTIAKNKLMNYYRKNKFEINSIPLVEDDAFFSQSEEDFITDLLQKEDQRKLLMTLGQLREDYIRIILMYYYYDIPLREISEILNVNYNTVVCWHRRALKHLGDLLSK